MSVKRILQLGDPLLWQECDTVENPASTSVMALAEDLRDTLLAFRSANGFGRGIAAPQIGEPRRVIVIDAPSAGFSGALVNPRIVEQSEKRVELWDGCFSFPGLLVKVSRAAEIKVEYANLTGVQNTLEATGDLSELLQHEIDHLDGVLAVQRAVSPQAFCTREEWERRGSE
ncbi:MAG: peptide deformylase [Candidatus Latescibacterota bacterium]|nr:MAG: peptide deformylase [Candidatus Latescibacterota bacterium]